MLNIKSVDDLVKNALKIINDPKESAYKKYFAYQAVCKELRAIADLLDTYKEMVFKVGVEQMQENTRKKA